MTPPIHNPEILGLPPDVLPMPGMRLRDGCRVLRVERDANGWLLIHASPGGQSISFACHCTRSPYWPESDEWQLDLSDPATQWGMVAIARTLWGSDFLHPAAVENVADRTLWGWVVYVNPFDKAAPEFRHRSLPHALLEAIWSKHRGGSPAAPPTATAKPCTTPPLISRANSLANDLVKAKIFDAVVAILQTQPLPFRFSAASLRRRLPEDLRETRGANVPVYVGQVLSVLASDWQRCIVKERSLNGQTRTGAYEYTLVAPLPEQRDCTAELNHLVCRHLQQQPLPYAFHPTTLRTQLHLDDVQTWRIAATIARIMAQHPDSFDLAPMFNDAEVTITLLRRFW